MSVTPNYNWPLIEPTDFVTNLPADFEAFGDAVDTTLEAIETKLDVITTEGDLIVGDASGDPVRVPIGTAGQVLTSDGDTVEWVAPASSGVNWTVRAKTRELGFNEILFARYENDRWIVAGESSAGGGVGRVAHSTDGITWTTVNPGGSAKILVVHYFALANLWIAGGNSGQLYTSPDLITWTSRTSQFSTAAIRTMASNASILVVGGDTRLTSSTNGTTYTSRSTTYNVFDVVWGAADSLFVTANSTTTASVGSASSANGTSWSGATTGRNIAQVLYVNDSFYGFSNNDTSLGTYSTDGTTWTNLEGFYTGTGAEGSRVSNFGTNKMIAIARESVTETAGGYVVELDANNIYDNYITTTRYAILPINQVNGSPNGSIAANGLEILIADDQGTIYTSF